MIAALIEIMNEFDELKYYILVQVYLGHAERLHHRSMYSIVVVALGQEGQATTLLTLVFPRGSFLSSSSPPFLVFFSHFPTIDLPCRSIVSQSHDATGITRPRSLGASNVETVSAGVLLQKTPQEAKLGQLVTRSSRPLTGPRVSSPQGTNR